MNTFIRLSLLTSLLLAGAMAAAAPALLLRDSPLRAEPALNAAEVAKLKSGTQLDTVGNQGGWSKVNTKAGQTGWVRLLMLQPVAVANSAGSAGVDTLGNVMRTGSTGGVATTGAKGIDRDQLEKAKPDYEQLKRLDQDAIDADAARHFADEIKLAARKLDYVDPNGKPMKGAPQ